MTEANALQAELRKVMIRFTTEFDLSVAEAVGVIELLKAELIHMIYQDQKLDDEDLIG